MTLGEPDSCRMRQGLTQHTVAGRRALCDEHGPISRCPCTVEAIQRAGHRPHWWVSTRGVGMFWCGGSLDQDWRQLIGT